MLDPNDIRNSRIEASANAASVNTRSGVRRRRSNAALYRPVGSTRMGVSATARINGKDFGLNWNAALEAGGFLVGEEVTIT